MIQWQIIETKNFCQLITIMSLICNIYLEKFKYKWNGKILDRTLTSVSAKFLTASTKYSLIERGLGAKLCP